MATYGRPVTTAPALLASATLRDVETPLLDVESALCVHAILLVWLSALIIQSMAHSFSRYADGSP